ncbi:hypothetical protein CYY_006632 [Polysphondylium violaceum]|uniref:N-acetyltransferase domain-containing protein n=1 Tax=Polysphondylium violaceum TaxID=133409 RepID=A0A8J4PQB8_9MYCE|nr:hypothetical protein CYY_006632 [Polysphondylium violaceum]
MAVKNVELGDLTNKNINQLKLLNSTILPISYDEKFYLNLLTNGFMTKLAFFNDVVVGAVSCRIDPPSDGCETSSLYIMTLGVLAPYRNLGIGKKLIEHLDTYCKSNKFSKIFLHVQVGSEAIEWYKKQNFQTESLITNYYRHIEPADCYSMSKTITPTTTTETNTTTSK